MGPLWSRGQDVGLWDCCFSWYLSSTDGGPGKSWGHSLGEEAKPASALGGHIPVRMARQKQGVARRAVGAWGWGDGVAWEIMSG